MKKLLALLVAAACVGSVLAEEAAKPETRKVCLTVKDKDGKDVKNKDGSVKENCKTVKAHQKHEGTKIEGAKK